MLRPLPKDRAAVLDGTIMATAADPLLVERLQVLGSQEGWIEIDAFPDMAERAGFLVKGGTCRPGSFEEEGQQDRDGENALFQTMTTRMVRRRSPF
jgi:hypothetical protein